MDAFNRLQFRILQDDVRERWNRFHQNIASLFARRHENKIGVSLSEASHDSEGRVWVEVGSEGLRLRVTHLHPANPSVSEALKRKCNERREAQLQGKDNSLLTGKLIYPPEDDKISISSLEDYWFNHWQGPYITADTNQNNYNSSKFRRSRRKSKRSSRCSMCQKKLVRHENDEVSESQFLEREENVLAHMPTVKIETRTVKEELDERSDDEISKSSINEDALSRISASDEQLSRVHRVVDNEMRTSYNLFVDDAVVSDVIDAPFSLEESDKFLDPSGSDRFLSPPLSPRQSRSCPCSPKLATRNYSPESVSNSPKLRSFVGLSKFSLSSSLLALHRQASNSFMPEFLKFDSGKGESPGTSKNNSQQSSMRAEARKVRHTLSDAGHHSREDTFRTDTHLSDMGPVYTKSPLQETMSLPPLKLSKMSLTYRGGVIISEENEAQPSSLETVSELGSPIIPFIQIDSPDNENDDETQIKNALPDVVPQVSSTDSFAGSSISGSTELNVQAGVVNLGFDGSGESSDFVDIENIKISVPSVSVNGDVDLSLSSKLALNCNDVPDLNSSSRCANENNENQILDISNGKSVSTSSTGESSLIEIKQEGEVTESQKETLPIGGPKDTTLSMGGTLDTLPVRLPNDTLPDMGQENNNTFIEKDVMQEAREMVFWWRKKTLNADDSEFCLHETECKVKQKPLLLFLHGIGSSADVWNQQLWYFLSCGYEIVAPDLLGHGMSSAPNDKKYYRFSQMLDYISLVFDLFVPQGRKCIVIGHNYGCALAAALARGRPLSVGLVVLASCGGPNPLVPHSKYENVLSSSATRFLSPLISCGCLSREILYTPRGKHYPVVTSDESGVPSTPRYVVEYTSQGQNWPEGDLPFHRRITIPALLLYGMKDNCVSFVEMCEMEKTIPRAFLELIPGAGHELMTDCAEEVCHAIHRFVRRWKHHI